MPERFSIAQVTPFAWEAPHEVNTFVARVSDELARRGHRVLIVAPSASRELVRESRTAIRAARDEPDRLLPFDDAPRLLGVGEVLPLAPTRRRANSVPVDVARTIEEALTIAPLDLVHVHEPFAPSAASSALRHSRALNVGSFHAPTERVLSTQVARKVVELFLGRLDARTADFQATRELMQRFFPADYRVIRPGADGAEKPAPSRGDPGPLRIAFVADEERAALRSFLRGLRALGEQVDWRATVWSRREGVPAGVLRRELRERVRFLGPGDCAEREVVAGADVMVAASSGIAPRPGLLAGGLVAGAVPVAARLAVYEEMLEGGELGLLFEPGDVDTLAAQLGRLAADGALRQRMLAAAAPARAQLRWERVADELEQCYVALAARRRRPPPGASATARKLAKRPLIDVDLHMHTDHSPDCATPVEALLATAAARGLGAIAVTDHNEVSGAHEARAKAPEVAPGLRVIVAEEVKTADQGEVIGLFIEEKIPRGMTLAQTIAEIKRQGGLVYVPHPFDRLHAVPDYEHLLAVVDSVDAIEVYNPRVAIGEFNEEAARFAAKYRIPAGAGSDSHVVQGLGSVRIRMRAFEGPEEFLASLRDADVVRKPTSLLYVQALKFLQTKATPKPAREGARERRVRRATRRRDRATGTRKS